MPAKGTHPITRTRFIAINREIKTGKPAIVIAQHYHVSVDTVDRVRLAGTYPEWVRRKEAHNKKNPTARRAPVTIASYPEAFSIEVPITDIANLPSHRAEMRLTNRLEHELADVSKRVIALEDHTGIYTATQKPKRHFWQLWRG